MSPLAFDKQGKPFAWHRRTRKLLVRMFRNPAARGTCCQVLDAEGNPLYIDAETDYAEFRKAVGNVPGLYRLDQCDDDGVEVDEAQPAYVSIDLTRNAALSGDDGEVNPLVIIEHMFAIHADVMKTMAMQQASIMAASAEILRAPFRPAAPAIEREPHEDEDDDEADDELETDPEPDPWAAWRPILKMVEPFLPKLGELLYEQFLNMAKKSKTSPPAAAPNLPPAPASAADRAATPSQTAESASAAAGSTAPATSGKSQAVATPVAPSAESVVTPGAVSATASATTGSAAAASTTTGPTKATTAAASVPPAAATATATTAPNPTAATALAVPSGESAPRNAALAPTPEQWEHLHVIREQLTPRERAIAENAIMRMDADVLTHYLAELSAMSVDEAVALIRSMVANLAPPRGPGRNQ